MFYICPNRRGVHSTCNHLLVSFLFIFQNDNDLIDNDNAGQSPAAQAVVLTFSLTYYLLLIHLFRFLLTVRLRSNSNHTDSFCVKCVPQKFPPISLSSLASKIIYYLARERTNLLQQTLIFLKIILFTQ